MDLLTQLMAGIEGTPHAESQQGMYTDIMTGMQYPTLEAFIAGREAEERRRMGVIQGGSGVGAFSGGFSGGFA